MAEQQSGEQTSAAPGGDRRDSSTANDGVATGGVRRTGHGVRRPRSNNTYQKLLECVTLEGVREHQAELQKIADNSTDPVYPGTRAAGTVGYDESVEYVAGLLRDAGYEVTLDPVDITFNFPAELRQLTPRAGGLRDRRLHRQRLGRGAGQRHPGRHRPDTDGRLHERLRGRRLRRPRLQR